MTLQRRYDMARIKAELLGIAANLDSDTQYSKDEAIEDILKVVDELIPDR